MMSDFGIEIIAAVKDALDDSWQTAQEIADKLHIRPRNVQTALGNLSTKGLVETQGKKPIRYRRHEKPDIGCWTHQHTEYKGEPMPYMRPGSYSPRSRPTIIVGVSKKE
ncbi:helix-turn-helix domain-containing protein [Acidithiobacillus sp. M4-SHS-6]|uniref:helix-turn-helix domain-containing protein n=1 Tax=Acidithiobacillus sp. M4-SHS-6 TaxID=3383024 RepID=UPI0039BDAE4F